MSLLRFSLLIYVIFELTQMLNADDCVCNYKQRCGRKALYPSSSCQVLFKQYSFVVQNLSSVGYALDYTNSDLMYLAVNWTNPNSFPPRVWNIQLGFSQLKSTCVVIETSQWDETDFYKKCTCLENLLSVTNIEERIDKFVAPSDRYTIFECN